MQLLGLFGGRVVAPKLGRTHRLVAIVEGNEPMLPGTCSKGHQLATALSNFVQTSENYALSCIGPDLRILLDVPAWESLNKRMPGIRLGENFSGVSFKNQTLAGGCPAIQAEAQHCRI